jgi:protocatechuate 3,4-dioxygenase beta subunit
MKQPVTHAVKNCWLLSSLALAVLINSGTATAQQPVGSPHTEGAATSTVGSKVVGIITGHVTNDSGQNLEGVRVYLQQAGAGLPLRQASTDENGEFRFDALRDGSYTIGALARGYFMPTQLIDSTPALYHLGDSVNIKLVKGGIITGKVLDARGAPIVGVSVRAIRSRDFEGSPPDSDSESAGQTDDRGIYRLYGLKPGTYLVAAGGSVRPSRVDPYKYDALTYYPSETRATATEISVPSGAETSGIDIRYHGDRGHVVSGNIVGLAVGSPAVSVMLLDSGSYSVAAFTNPSSNNANQTFSFHNVADGEYELVIRSNNFSFGPGFMAIRHVTVKGADVAGLKISPFPLGSMSGQIEIDSSAKRPENSNCNASQVIRPETVLLTARKSAPAQTKSVNPMLPSAVRSSANQRGQFKFYNLGEGIYNIEAQLPNDDWYVKSIMLFSNPSTAELSTSSKAIDIARNGLSVKVGENLGNVLITLAYGAASLQGQMPVTTKNDLAQRVSLHLLSAEPEFEDDPLHYAEVPVSSDGSFIVRNVPPGRYWLLIKPAFYNETNTAVNAIAWDANKRTRLRDEGKLGGRKVQLGPCQRVTDYILSYGPLNPLSNKPMPNKN